MMNFIEREECNSENDSIPPFMQGSGSALRMRGSLAELLSGVNRRQVSCSDSKIYAYVDLIDDK